MLTWTYIIVFDISVKHNFETFYYIHIVDIPTNKEQSLTNQVRVRTPSKPCFP